MKAGDIVIGTEGFEGNNIKGVPGLILEVKDRFPPVAFFKQTKKGHNIGGRLPTNTGWYTGVKALRLPKSWNERFTIITKYQKEYNIAKAAIRND